MSQASVGMSQDTVRGVDSRASLGGSGFSQNMGLIQDSELKQKVSGFGVNNSKLSQI